MQKFFAVKTASKTPKTAKNLLRNTQKSAQKKGPPVYQHRSFLTAN